jgi:hypothetical protein
MHTMNTFQEVVIIGNRIFDIRLIDQTVTINQTTVSSNDLWIILQAMGFNRIECEREKNTSKMSQTDFLLNWIASIKMICKEEGYSRELNFVAFWSKFVKWSRKKKDAREMLYTLTDLTDPTPGSLLDLFLIENFRYWDCEDSKVDGSEFIKGWNFDLPAN